MDNVTVFKIRVRFIVRKSLYNESDSNGSEFKSAYIFHDDIAGDRNPKGAGNGTSVHFLLDVIIKRFVVRH